MYWCIDALRMQIVRKSKNSNNYEMFYVNAAGRRNVLCQRRGTTEYFMPTPRDACPGAQTCCASPTRTPARLANSRRTWSRRRTRKSLCVSAAVSVELQLACPDVGKFSRASSAGGRQHLQIKFRKSDRVGRRGLSEPREDFSRLHTYGIP